MKISDVYHEILKKHKLPNSIFSEPLLFLCLLSYNQFTREEIGERLREFDEEKLKGIKERPDYLIFLSLFYLLYYKHREKKGDKELEQKERLKKKKKN